MDDTRLNCNYSLKAIAVEKNRYWTAGDDYKIRGELRSFPSTSIGCYSTSITFCGIEFGVEIIPHTTSGYYDGFNLDYTISFTCADLCGYFEIDELMDEIKYFNDARMLKLNKSKLHNKLEKIAVEMCDEVESVFALYADTYNEFCTFSNGETIYQKSA